MSACSASERRAIRAGTLLILALLAPAVVAARAATHARAHHVRHAHAAVAAPAAPSATPAPVDSSGAATARDHDVTDIDIGDGHVSIGEAPDGDHHEAVRLGRTIHIHTDDAGFVRMFSDVFVDSTEDIDGNVVALFGSTTVLGHVSGDVVAVLGSVHLGPRASVDGDAVAVGGELTQPPSAKIQGESVSLTFLPILAGVPPLRVLFIALFTCWLFAVVLGALLALLLPRMVVRIAETISERTLRSLLLGLALPPAAVIVAVLLLLTLIGIPVALLLPLLYLGMLWMGMIASSALLGYRLTGRAVGQGGPVGPLVAASLLVTGLFGIGALFAGHAGPLGFVALFFPTLGLLLVTALAVLGSGAMLAALGDRGRSSAAGPVAAPPPSVVAPPAPGGVAIG